MKKLGLVAVISLSSLQTVSASDNGFCVPRGQQFILENAIVVVKGQQVDDRDFNVFPKGHQFFDSRSLTTQLATADWGGVLLLQKTGAVRGNIIEATFENSMHGTNIPIQHVDCIADEIARAAVFAMTALGAANVASCGGSGFSARHAATGAARKAAQDECRFLRGGNEAITVFEEKEIFSYRGSCWAGTQDGSAVMIKYLCLR